MKTALCTILGASLAALAVSPAAFPGSTSGQFPAARHEVSIGTGQPLTVLTGFLLGGPLADIAVVGPVVDEPPRLHIYSRIDGVWTLAVDEPLAPDLVFVDLVRIAGRDRLVTYAPGRLAWHVPGSGLEEPLAAVNTELDLPGQAGIPHVNVTEDVNGDGRDDLVIPVSHGFSVYLQTEEGAFAEPFQAGVRAHDLSRHSVGYRLDPWAQGRIFTVDLNLDGRADLLHWNGDHFRSHIQDAQGGFATDVSTLSSPVAFDSDDLAALAAPDEARQRHGDTNLEGAMNGRVLHSVADMNGDRVADLVVFSLAAGDDDAKGQTAQMWRMHARQEVHLGAPAARGGVEFSPDAGAVVSFDGIPFGWEQRDLDGDGRVDLMLTGMDPGVFKAAGMIFSALFTRSLAMHLEMYRLSEAGYPASHTARRKIRVGIGDGPAARAANFPIVLLLHANADDRLDLLVGKGGNTLQQYDGIDAPGLFTRHPRKLAVKLPSDEEYAWLDDLDGDGREDLVLHLRSEGEPDRVRLLLAPASDGATPDS